MRTKLLLQPLVLLILAHGIETRDETARETNATKDDVVLPIAQSENRLNTTEQNPSSTQTQTQTPAKLDDRYTAGNTLCRSDHKCDFHGGATYKYCYVDYSNNWDYCCTDACGYHGKSYMWCQSGDQWQYCGHAGTINIDGSDCYPSHPCGMHQEKGKENTYWCYVDHKLNWNRCCAPSSTCDYRGEANKWCYTGYENETKRYECQRFF